jgi:hypothetical protein
LIDQFLFQLSPKTKVAGVKIGWHLNGPSLPSQTDRSKAYMALACLAVQWVIQWVIQRGTA